MVKEKEKIKLSCGNPDCPKCKEDGITTQSKNDKPATHVCMSDEATCKRIKGYADDKIRFFKQGDSERSKAIVEVLTQIQYILDGKI